jgi:hypothetical protein
MMIANLRTLGKKNSMIRALKDADVKRRGGQER